MEKKSKTQYSWYPEKGICYDVFDSIEEAVGDAQNRYDNGDEPYEDEYTPAIICVGPVRSFDMENAVKVIAENIEDDIYEQMANFSSGCDFESECQILKLKIYTCLW
jgi:hypothetical protein